MVDCFGNGLEIGGHLPGVVAVVQKSPRTSYWRGLGHLSIFKVWTAKTE
jgi:hypothetical protein